ncbi:lachesin [Caerostris darwini]|uniref:Lachesin n=1 Tax=Caerostris darwini TaxID=1538125 RepID=A0AAV4S3I4_9ARAC|nr:lachesin [Caerostris darwini]
MPLNKRFCQQALFLIVLFGFVTNATSIFVESLVDEPTTVTLTVGENVSLTCITDEIHPHNVSWFHVNPKGVQEKLITEHSRFYTHQEDETWWLKITNATIDDGGKYMCQINNGKIEKVGYLQVIAVKTPKVTPSFAEPIPNITVLAGSNVSIPCTVNNLQHYKVSWIHSGNKVLLTVQNIVFTGSWRFKVSHNYKTWWLHISHVRKSDRGMYMCQISTSTMIGQYGYLDVLAHMCEINNGKIEQVGYLQVIGDFKHTLIALFQFLLLAHMCEINNGKIEQVGYFFTSHRYVKLSVNDGWRIAWKELQRRIQAEPPSLNPCESKCGLYDSVFGYHLPLYVQVPWAKTRLLMADPPEDDDPRLDCGPDPWNFAAQIDWEWDDDGYPM